MPVAAVIELDEYIAWRGFGSESPKRDKNSYEARNMQQQQSTFNGRKIFGQYTVKKEWD